MKESIFELETPFTELTVFLFFSMKYLETMLQYTYKKFFIIKKYFLKEQKKKTPAGI